MRGGRAALTPWAMRSRARNFCPSWAPWRKAVRAAAHRCPWIGLWGMRPSPRHTARPATTPAGRESTSPTPTATQAEG